MFIFRPDLFSDRATTRRLRSFIRKRLAAQWSAYVRERPPLKRMLVKERARGDLRARIEPGYGLLSGIRLSDGSLIYHRIEPLSRNRKPAKREKPFVPTLHQFEEGHERAGQLVLLKSRERKRLIRRAR